MTWLAAVACRAVPAPVAPSPSESGSPSPVANAGAWQVEQEMFLFPERILSKNRLCPSATRAGDSSGILVAFVMRAAASWERITESDGGGGGVGAAVPGGGGGGAGVGGSGALAVAAADGVAGAVVPGGAIVEPEPPPLEQPAPTITMKKGSESSPSVPFLTWPTSLTTPR